MQPLTDDLHVTLMIWVGPACPMWIYEMGVPKVYSDREVNPLGQKMSLEQNRFPYYLAPQYKKRFFELIDAFGDYVNDLPPKLRERIIFVQSAEGSTGDGQPYKGEPLDAQYAISKEVWNDFRMETWKAYQKAVPGIPILVNSDANTKEQSKWLLDNMDVIALKQGMFSHGYHVSNNVERLDEFPLAGSRGQKARQASHYSRRNGCRVVCNGLVKPKRAASALLVGAVRDALSVGCLEHSSHSIEGPGQLSRVRLFQQICRSDRPRHRARGFLRLRDGLDASDFDRFPAAEFGGKEGNKRDVGRYLRIAEAYSQRGARMDDPEKAIGGGMINRKRNGSNDVGWGILPGNYFRFLTQIDPGSGDVGRWNIDDSIYGRFARSFDHAVRQDADAFQARRRLPGLGRKGERHLSRQGNGILVDRIPGNSGGTLSRIPTAASGKPGGSRSRILRNSC